MKPTVPDPLPLDLDNYVPALLSWLNNKLSAGGSSLYRERFGIGIADWRVLAYLGVKTSGTGAEISEFLGMDKAAVSRSIASLKQKGLATAKKPGRRSIELLLTAKGALLYNEILDVALVRERALLDGFSDEERLQSITLLQRMLANLPKVHQAGDGI
ncbi:MAG: MarR family transcriptional regulator [Rhodobiaceae bacterium]|nr:MarR family transcriptional regulator [Rhodobiaceae bacterium]MCC0054603.1 MarR family transcriptional regulator [Rhodobiaceae bacterium]